MDGFIAGTLFLLSAPSIYQAYKDVSKSLSIASVLFIAIFAVGTCIFTCFFSVNETKDAVPVKRIEVVAAIIKTDDKILATQRGYGEFVSLSKRTQGV